MVTAAESLCEEPTGAKARMNRRNRRMALREERRRP
jgi:hypothetical protein